MPLMHPLRATNGWVGEVATTFEIENGRTGFCHVGCEDTKGGGFYFNAVQGSIGYSHVTDGWLGTMVGVYSPAFENQKNNYAFAALWTYFTAQNDYLAAGVGPEIGPGGVAVLSGLELQPLGMKRTLKWVPAIGVYGRWFFPYDPTDTKFDARTTVAEYGARARYGALFLEYSFYNPSKSLMMYSLPVEGSAYVRAFHLLTLGFTFDEITKRSLHRDPPPKPPPRRSPELPPD